VSVSTVGRTITRLKDRGVLRESIPNFISARKRYLKSAWGSTPFSIRAIQIDGGSEFKGAFEEACKQRGICGNNKEDVYGMYWTSTLTSKIEHSTIILYIDIFKNVGDI
jgi:hypothetical protein